METFDMVRFEIKIIFCEIKKILKLFFYYSWVDHFKCDGMKISVLVK